jgi:hypothetical protein
VEKEEKKEGLRGQKEAYPNAVAVVFDLEKLETAIFASDRNGVRPSVEAVL